MNTDKFVKVKKGDIVTNAPAHALNNYLKNGWVKLDEGKKEPIHTYDNYTKKQLLEMVKNRNLYAHSRMNKSDIIQLLIDYDNRNASKPSNTGFTDNLIKE